MANRLQPAEPHGEEVEWYHDFVDLKRRPSRGDLVALFRIIPAPGFTMSDAAGRVASESSVGTWTTLTTLTPAIRKIMAKAYDINGDMVRVAYPGELFEGANMPQVLSSIAGNIFSMKAVSGLRLVDIVWPKELVESFPGAEYGSPGIRKFMKVPKRPLTASVPKPKLGLTAEEHALHGYEAWTGGLDLLKDDENLTDQSFNSFSKRAKLSYKYRDNAEKETGEKKSYLINITAETREMEKRAKMVHDLGGEFVMIDICTTGWASLQTMRGVCGDLHLAVHAHRAFHAAFTRNPSQGMSMAILAETARLIGADQLHIGTAIGKLEATREEVVGLRDKVYLPKSPGMGWELEQDWYGKKPLLPVSSGGLHVGLLYELLDILGTDIVVQLGGGIWGHPLGGRAGSKALRDAIDGYMKGQTLEDCAERSPELKVALEKWGTSTYK
ncbi:MAG: type III ribulose-bisphosphate carboxylase [Nitrososphaerota archaeon]|jgi:ribulose-bisphosphate carboxylase large chain|nr:type III ribulose-bisphosphate carboxylase [Nitrososphaerota archaeon]